MATAHAEIRLPDDTVLAEAELLLTEPPHTVFTVSDADQLGWKVYDD
jgi:hypothetical protein